MTAYETDIGTATVRGIQFENVNEGRSYPFGENVNLTTTDGLVLPDELFADAKLIIPSATEAFLSSVYISGNMVSVCIRIVDFNTTTLRGALSVTVTRDTLEPYIPYRLEKLSGSEDIGGIVTFGNIDTKGSEGSYRFPDRQVVFTDSVVIRCAPASLRRIVDDRTGESLSGDVSLDFPNYVAAEQTYDDDGNIAVRLSLKEGADKVLMADCDKKRTENACGAIPISSINGVAPDEYNRIVLWFH